MVFPNRFQIVKFEIWESVVTCSNPKRLNSSQLPTFHRSSMLSMHIRTHTHTRWILQLIALIVMPQVCTPAFCCSDDWIRRGQFLQNAYPNNCMMLWQVGLGGIGWKQSLHPSQVCNATKKIGWTGIIGAHQVFTTDGVGNFDILKPDVFHSLVC